MKNKITAMVYSPARTRHLREGDGFSIPEINKSNRTIDELKRLKIKVDYDRRSSHSFNIEKLNELEVPEIKRKSRKPFIKKEKKRTAFIPPTIEKVEIKEKAKPKIKKEKKVEKEPDSKVTEIIPLTELDGIGPATEDKFKQLGIEGIQDLIKEDPKELATLIKGASEEGISNWIEQGKKILLEKKFEI
ncbi:MAG: hypothetical protein P8Y97_04515 [Candidatus Lokiarchaeota archaeon]